MVGGAEVAAFEEQVAEQKGTLVRGARHEVAIEQLPERSNVAVSSAGLQKLASRFLDAIAIRFECVGRQLGENLMGNPAGRDNACRRG